MKERRRLILSLAFLATLIALIVVMVLRLYPLIVAVVQNADDETRMINYIEAYGNRGALLIGALQALSVFVVFVPKTAVQILSGLCYGIGRGTLICVAGNVAGNMAYFAVAKRLGPSVVEFMAHRRGEKEPRFDLSALQRARHPGALVVLLYALPVMPNVLLPPLFAGTGIGYGRYLLGLSVASVPSILLSVWLGERIAQGDGRMVIVLAAVIVALGAVLFAFRKRIFAWVQKMVKSEIGEEKADG